MTRFQTEVELNGITATGIRVPTEVVDGFGAGPASAESLGSSPGHLTRPVTRRRRRAGERRHPGVVGPTSWDLPVRH